MYKYLKFFEELSIDDIPTVGGKNASLGEMYHHLRPQGVNLPNGVATTADAYRYFLSEAGINQLPLRIYPTPLLPVSKPLF